MQAGELMLRNYEIAANPYGIEYGSAPGPVTHIDGKRIATLKTVDDGKVLQGLACLWNKPVVSGGKIKSICRGAFDKYLATKPTVGFWLDHDENKVIGDTSNGLELLPDSSGLAFRFRFPDTTLGKTAKQLVRDGAYSGISVGFTYKKNRVKIIEGEEVSLVEDAWLQEVSLVKHGAIDEAFGILVDPRGTLKDALPTMNIDGAFRNLIRVIHKLKDCH